MSTNPYASLPEDVRALVDQRLDVCMSCDQFKGPGATNRIYVQCRACGCSNLRLHRDDCPKKKWPKSPRAPQLLVFETEPGTPARLTNLFRGTPAFLICSGPSFANLDRRLLRQPGILTMGVNNSPKTFRPNMWTAVDSPDRFLLSVFRDPSIMKFSHRGSERHLLWDSSRNEWSKYRMRDSPNTFYHELGKNFDPKTFLTSSKINWGHGENNEPNKFRSVMLVPFRILYELGCRTIFILGADFKMSDSYTYHFQQSREPRSVTGNTRTYKLLNERFDQLRPVFDQAGLSVYNCNPDSGLRSFPHMPFGEAIGIAKDQFGNIDTERESTKELYNTVHVRGRIKDTVTLITATGDRHDSFRLLEKWIRQQTWKGDIQWIVVDDGKRPTICHEGQKHIRRRPESGEPAHTMPLNVMEAIPHIKSQKLLIIEDDDYYGPKYIETMAKWLDKYELAGLGYTTNYRGMTDPPQWRTRSNIGNSSLAATGFRGPEAIEFLKKGCERKLKYVDMWIWREWTGTKYTHCDPDLTPTLIVQMKGMLGRPGVTKHHQVEGHEYRPDHKYAMLKKWIGFDAGAYMNKEPLIATA